MPELNIFSNKSRWGTMFFQAVCYLFVTGYPIDRNYFPFFQSLLEISLFPLLLNLLSITGQMERRASYDCWLSVKQAIGKWILTSSFYDNSSDIKFDNQHDASPASTKAKVSAAIVLLTIQQIFLDCHIIRDKFP